MQISLLLLQLQINLLLPQEQNNYNFENQELTEELHKLVIRKFKKRKVYSSFKLNIWGTDATDIQLESKYSKEFDFYYVFLILLINMHVLFL